MTRLSLSVLAVIGLVISACAGPPPSSTEHSAANSMSAGASGIPAQRPPSEDCTLTVKHVHAFADDMGREPEEATVLHAQRLGEPYRVEMTGRHWGSGTPNAAYVSAFGEGWGGVYDVVETAPDGAVHAYGIVDRRPSGWGTSLTNVGTHMIELSSPHNDCATTLVFEVVEARATSGSPTDGALELATVKAALRAECADPPMRSEVMCILANIDAIAADGTTLRVPSRYSTVAAARREFCRSIASIYADSLASRIPAFDFVTLVEADVETECSLNAH